MPYLHCDYCQVLSIWLNYMNQAFMNRLQACSIPQSRSSSQNLFMSHVPRIPTVNKMIIWIPSLLNKVHSSVLARSCNPNPFVIMATIFHIPQSLHVPVISSVQVQFSLKRGLGLSAFFLVIYLMEIKKYVTSARFVKRPSVSESIISLHLNVS